PGAAPDRAASVEPSWWCRGSCYCQPLYYFPIRCGGNVVRERIAFRRSPVFALRAHSPGLPAGPVPATLARLLIVVVLSLHSVSGCQHRTEMNTTGNLSESDQTRSAPAADKPEKEPTNANRSDAIVVGAGISGL